MRWPKPLAWAEPVDERRVNPHHHTGNYRGDFDSIDLSWVTWQPYAKFYDRVEYANDYDSDLMDAAHIALARIPMMVFDVVEYAMPDRVLRNSKRLVIYYDNSKPARWCLLFAHLRDVIKKSPVLKRKLTFPSLEDSRFINQRFRVVITA